MLQNHGGASACESCNRLAGRGRPALWAVWRSADLGPQISGSGLLLVTDGEAPGYLRNIAALESTDMLAENACSCQAIVHQIRGASDADVCNLHRPGCGCLGVVPSTSLGCRHKYSAAQR